MLTRSSIREPKIDTSLRWNQVIVLPPKSIDDDLETAVADIMGWQDIQDIVDELDGPNDNNEFRFNELVKRREELQSLILKTSAELATIDEDISGLNIGRLSMQSQKYWRETKPCRTRLTWHQKSVLKTVFANVKHPAISLRLEIASMLDLDVKVINTWFINKRKRENYDDVNVNVV
mgnify:CR=1 FL=1|tara:strand:+ start:643 stop:1173 length:531 start_codon:yes stop_codon:yes gene_type:complete